MTLILLDIDGPLNPFLCTDDRKWTVWGGDWNTGRFDVISLYSRFSELRAVNNVEFVWASAWEEESRTLEPILGLPYDMRTILFRKPSESDSTWKLPSVEEWLRANGMMSEPLVWLDDEFLDDADAWARDREGDTLLIRVDPAEGWTDKQFRLVLDFCISNCYVP